MADPGALTMRVLTHANDLRDLFNGHVAHEAARRLLRPLDRCLNERPPWTFFPDIGDEHYYRLLRRARAMKLDKSAPANIDARQQANRKLLPAERGLSAYCQFFKPANRANDLTATWRWYV